MNHCTGTTYGIRTGNFLEHLPLTPDLDVVIGAQFVPFCRILIWYKAREITMLFLLYLIDFVHGTYLVRVMHGVSFSWKIFQ